MTNTRIILFSIMSAILLTMLILWCAEVLAHGEGKCLTDVDGNVPLSNGGWVKVIDHLEGADLRGYVHGHLKQYYDKNGNPTTLARSFSRVDFNDDDEEFYADCSPPPPPPPPPRSEPRAPTPITEILKEAKEALPEDVEVPEPVDVPVDVPDDLETPEPPDDVGVPEACLEEFEHTTFRQGLTLWTPRLLPDDVQTISELYDSYSFKPVNNVGFYVLIDGQWLGYRGEGSVGEIPLAPHIGIIVHQPRISHFLITSGCPVTNQDSIELNTGMNLIGFPQVPARFERPSDFLSDAVCAVLVERNGELYIIGRAGDTGDEPLRAGQAIMIISLKVTTLNLTEAAPSAPSAAGTLAVGWGVIKMGEQ